MLESRLDLTPRSPTYQPVTCANHLISKSLSFHLCQMGSLGTVFPEALCWVGLPSLRSPNISGRRTGKGQARG